MTAAEFVAFRAAALHQIREIELSIGREYAKARRRKPPRRNRLRPATARDIVEGALIWHSDGDEGWFWNIVEEVLCPSDDFKAYTADDGCRYGLHNALVEIKP